MEPFSVAFLTLFLGAYILYIVKGVVDTVRDGIVLDPSPYSTPIRTTSRPSVAIVKNRIAEREFFLDEFGENNQE